jgi:hypothetical protein
MELTETPCRYAQDLCWDPNLGPRNLRKSAKGTSHEALQ